MNNGDFIKASPALQIAVRNALSGKFSSKKVYFRGFGRNSLEEYEPLNLDCGEVLVKLQSENATLEDFAAMALVSPAILATDENFIYSLPYFYIAPVTESNKDNPFVICEEIPDTDQFVRAVLSGVIKAKVTISDASHKYVKPNTSVDGYLISSATGTAKILWKAGTIGEQWCWIELGASGEGGSSSSYSGYFKLYLIAETSGATTTYKVRIADGATYQSESSVGGNSTCKVNNATFPVASYLSAALTDNMLFYLEYDSSEETVVIKASTAMTLPSDTDVTAHYQIGRFYTGTTPYIVQDHTSVSALASNGIPQIWWVKNEC